MVGRHSPRMDRRNWSVFVGLLVISSVILTVVDSIKFSVKNLSSWQTETIKELRRQIIDELPHEYMDDDLYYGRFLSAKNYHVDEAVDMMRKNFKWRKQNYMDSILKENWREMENEFPYQLDTSDREGRPVLYIKMGDWNVGRMSNMLRLHHLARYFSKIMEEADTRVRRKRARGYDISQIIVLVNMEGYSIGRHGCFHCFNFYSQLSSNLQSHYPRVAERVTFLNAPVMFTVVFDSLQRMLNLEDRQTMELFGTDRNRWEAALTNYIDRSQFPRDLADFKKHHPGNYSTPAVPVSY